MRKLIITLTILMLFALLASFAAAGTSRNGGRACTRGRGSWCATATPIPTSTVLVNWWPNSRIASCEPTETGWHCLDYSSGEWLCFQSADSSIQCSPFHQQYGAPEWW